MINTIQTVMQCSPEIRPRSAVTISSLHDAIFFTNFQILLTHISTVERLPITTTGSPLLVRTKTFQSVFFVIPRERDCHEMHQTLLRLSQPGNDPNFNSCCIKGFIGKHLSREQFNLNPRPLHSHVHDR